MQDIIDIVRSAITEGLITSDHVEHFDDAVSTLRGKELEDYIQNLWDNIS